MQADAAKGQSNLFDMLGDTSAKPSAVSHSDAKMPLTEKLKHEKELLGLYVSGHPMNDYHGIAEAVDTLTEATFHMTPDRTPFRLCGVITTIAKRFTKKDKSHPEKPQRQWASFKLETRRESFPINLFPSSFEENGGKLMENRVVMLSGDVRYNPERQEHSLNVANIVDIDEALTDKLIRGLTWVLNPEKPEAARAFIDAFSQMMMARNESGGTRIRFGFRFPNSQILEAEAPRIYGWAFNAKAFAKWRKHPALEGVLFDIPDPEPPPSRWRNRFARR